MLKPIKGVGWGLRYQTPNLMNADLSTGYDPTGKKKPVVVNNNGMSKSNPFLDIMQDGGVSKMGYKNNSPYKNNPYLDIYSPGGSITMQGVSKHLLGADSNGNVQYMTPGNEYRFTSPQVTELPMGKDGIYIKPSHKGAFTAYKQRTGKTTEEALHSSNAHVRQMANFARNASHWNKKQYGGYMQQGGMSPQQAEQFLFGEDDAEDQYEDEHPELFKQQTQQQQPSQQEQLEQQAQLLRQQREAQEQEQHNTALKISTALLNDDVGSLSDEDLHPVITDKYGPIKSSGEQGTNNIGQYGREIADTIASQLGYMPTFNSIYRTPEQQESLVKQGIGAKNSWHLTGNAVDMQPEEFNKLPKTTQQWWKNNYDVLNEGNHIHIEPKGSPLKQLGGVFYQQGQTLDNITLPDIIKLKKKGIKFSFVD